MTLYNYTAGNSNTNKSTKIKQISECNNYGTYTNM